jgi:hypothetical protein
VKPKLILTLSSLIYFLRAFGLIFAPMKLFEMYGITLDRIGEWNGQFLGAILLGIGILNWLVRELPDDYMLRRILIANLFLDGASFIFSLKGTLNGLFGSAGWAPTIQHLIFVVLFGMLLLRKKATDVH